MDGQEDDDLDLPPLSGALATPAKDHAMATPGSGLPAVASGGGKRLGECTAAPPEGLAAPTVEALAVPAEGLDAAAESMSTALALARSLLPTAPPPPTVEYNLPVVDVQRYAVNYFMLLYLYSRRSHTIVG
jgi:hypothetical protein